MSRAAEHGAATAAGAPDGANRPSGLWVPGRGRGLADRAVSRVLLANYAVPNCGVHQYGRSLLDALSGSRALHVEYRDVGSLRELDEAVAAGEFAAVLVNYHPHTMSFVKLGATRRYRVPCIAIMHEMTQAEADAARRGFFQAYVMGDPTLREHNAYVHATGRIIPPYENPYPVPEVPTIGSFGFSVASKGFGRLVDAVQAEFDHAVIRINIPSNGIMDPKGVGARRVADGCRGRVRKPGVRLEITHDFLTHPQLLDFLARNSLNAFLYDRLSTAGISSAVDHAMTVRRPVAVTNSIMFRHLLGLEPPVTVERSSLKDIQANGTKPYEHLLQQWSPESICRRYEQIVARVLDLDDPSEPCVSTPVEESARSGGPEASRRSLPARAFTIGTRLVAQRARALVRPAVALRPVAGRVARRTATFARYMVWAPLLALGAVKPRSRFNRILGDRARLEYRGVIRELEALVPHLMSKKIPRANVQQAFVFDTVRRFAAGVKNPRLLCVGSYEDSAAAALAGIGLAVDEIDPVVNQLDLAGFCALPTTRPGSYDVVFSTSVIEHVRDDEEFIRQIEALLAPGGVCVLTCDYQEGYRRGDALIAPNWRFYTKGDLAGRLAGVLREADLVDLPAWDAAVPDFELGGFHYTFASLVFRKRQGPASER